MTRLVAAAAKLRLFYIRFMDDILILAPTRWQLRGAVKVVNQMLGALMLEKHPTRRSSAGSSEASISSAIISARRD
jgi:RNA-directed DNA polymerase